MGKRLGDSAKVGMYFGAPEGGDEGGSTTETVVLDTDDFGAIVAGQHTWGSGFQSVATVIAGNRATETDIIENNLPETFDIYVPSGYQIGIRFFQSDGGPSGGAGAYTEWITTAGWNTVTNRDAATWPYIAMAIGRTDSAVITSAHLETLNAEVKIRYEIETEVEPVEPVEPAFAQKKAVSIVDEAGDEVFAMSSPSATEGGETEIYSKGAVDNLLANFSPSSSDTGSYRTPKAGIETDDEQVMTFPSSDFSVGVRIVGNGGIGTVSSNTARATLNKIYYCGEGDAPSGTEKLDLSKFTSFYVPSGYNGSPTFAAALTQGASAVYPTGWKTGLCEITAEHRAAAANYPYMVFNFTKGSGSSTIGSSDLAAIAAGFEITSIAAATNPANAAIEIVDANGVATKKIYNDDDHNTVSVYSKSAIDTLLGGDTPSNRIIRVASWNIGHLSYGASSSGGYSGDTAVSKQKAWRKAVNGLAANILCCQEYEPGFGTLNSETVTTADAVMGGIYAYNSIGGKNNYQCQAIFSKSALANGQDVYYNLNGNNTGGAYRYQKAEITIDGKTVTIISCHFPILNGNWNNSIQRATMNEIITACANIDYAIVCMDSNFETTDRFDNFISAKFKLANHGDFGDIKTWPTDGVKAHNANLADWWPTKALDCIAVKGFKVSNVQIYSDSELTDHCAIIADLTMV